MLNKVKVIKKLMKISTLGYKITTQRSLMVLQSPLPDDYLELAQGTIFGCCFILLRNRGLDPQKGTKSTH